jgi:hypothetical protein
MQIMMMMMIMLMMNDDDACMPIDPSMARRGVVTYLFVSVQGVVSFLLVQVDILFVHENLLPQLLHDALILKRLIDDRMRCYVMQLWSDTYMLYRSTYFLYLIVL